MTDEELKEFAYHLRELLADLGLIRDDLEVAAGPATDGRAIRRAWTGAWALLEHDLEVHLPKALALLGKPIPTLQVSQGRCSGAATVPASAAREARRLVDLALTALPPNDIDPPLAANKLADIAGVVHAAYQITDEMVKLASSHDAEEEGGSE